MVASPVGPALHGAAAAEVAAGGVRFHLHRAGPSRRRRTTPALLLHGVPQTALCWSGLLPELARDRTVLAPDLKGLGGSEAQGGYDARGLVAELAALVLHEVDGPVDVVGHDRGGTLALALAAARPELVRRLVVVAAPYGRADLPAAWYPLLLGLPLLPDVALRVAGDRLVRGLFGYAWRAAGGPAHLADYVAAYRAPDRVAAMLGYCRNGMEGHVAGRRVRVERSLAVWGAEDPLVPARVGERLVRDLGPTASLLTLPGVGHWPVEEAPDVVVPAIAELLRAP